MGVSREDFVMLLKDSQVEEIKEEGKVVAAEGSPISQELSLLLSGRLVVKANNCILHKIDKNNFLQSIEWSSRRHESQLAYYQVSMEAEQCPVMILHLSSYTIGNVIDTREDLRLIIECLVAKDVSMKMYMMNKMIGDTDVTVNKMKSKKMEKDRKSSSMDAINTGWKGLMRSYFWSEVGSGDANSSVGGFNRCLDMPVEEQKLKDSRDHGHGQVNSQSDNKMVWPFSGVNSNSLHK